VLAVLSNHASTAWETSLRCSGDVSQIPPEVATPPFIRSRVHDRAQLVHVPPGVCQRGRRRFAAAGKKPENVVLCPLHDATTDGSRSVLDRVYCVLGRGVLSRRAAGNDFPVVVGFLMQDACRIVAATTTLLLACWAGAVTAADEPAPRPPVAFEPGDISIGEPIALPFAAPTAPNDGAPASQPPSTSTTVPMAAVKSAGMTAVPTPVAGWLGMAVAESKVPGRWSIVEVVPTGPAAAVGILPGDELRSINGTPLQNADEVSQSLTAIAAGQNVRLSVARADQVSDVVLTAVPRPTVAAVRERQQAGAEGSLPPAQPLYPLAVLPSVSIPAAAVPPEMEKIPAGTADAALAPPPATASVLVGPPAMPSDPPARPALQTEIARPAPAFPAPAARPSTLPHPVAAPSATASASRGRTALGVRTVPIDPGIQTRFRLPQAAGAYVIGVVGDLPASKAGIPPGSVIVSLGDRPVRSPQELTQLVSAGPIDRPVSLLYVLPGGAEKRADVVLQSLELPLEQALVGDDALQPVTAPTFEAGPAGPVGSTAPGRLAQRPISTADAEVRELRRETLRLRSLLDVLERRLDRLSQ
jgi:S1-C subfamily serine protease